MSKAETKVFIVGDRDYGVVIVAFEPFHVIRITSDAIQDYADKHFRTGSDGYDKTFDILGRSVLSMVTDLSDKKFTGDIDVHKAAYLDLISNRGLRLSNAEFCVIGKIDPARHDEHLEETEEPLGGLEARRKSHSMLHNALKVLMTDNKDEPIDIELEEDN